SIIPIGVSLMREHLSPHRAATGVALMSGTMGIGSATGLPLSGVLTKFGGLGAIFWASAVASAIFFALTFAVVPRHGSRTGGAFDAVGTVLFTISLTALLLFISKGGEWGVSSPTTLTTLGVAIVAFSIWIRHQFVTSSPLVDLRSSLSRPILTTNVASFFISVGMFSNYLLTIQEARAPVESEIGLGLSGLAGGAILIPSAVAMIVLSPVAARVLVRFGGKTGLVGGAVVILLAYAFRLVVPGTLLTVVAGTLAIGIGTTFAFAAMPTLIMDWVESEKAAAANGLNSLIRNLAGAVTTAAYGFLFVLAPWQADPTYLSRQGLLLGFAAVCACSLIGIGVALSLPRSP
ncbi:MAG TPA: MFS transporter, partial [Beutenbergiaceae bacterium]|nr:MFS transporter [Beutenbergiaceae bacterium]